MFRVEKIHYLKLKKKLDTIKNRLDIIEEKISGFRDNAIEINQKEIYRKNDWGKKRNRALRTLMSYERTWSNDTCQRREERRKRKEKHMKK